MADEMQYKDHLTLDEIVFEKRNKEYGAYDLRTMYPKLLTKSFIIGTFLFLILALSPLIYTTIKRLAAPPPTEVKADMMEILEDDPILDQPKEEEPPPKEEPPKEEPKVEVIQNIVPEPVKAPKIEQVPPKISEQLKTNTGAENVEGDKKIEYKAPEIKPQNPGKSDAVETKKQVTNEVYGTVDQAAEYPGGMNGLRKFLFDNFDTSVVEGGDGGTLKTELKFVVEKDGSVSDVKVIKKSGDKDFDNEAIRVVKKLKKFTPGKVDGQAVRSYFSVPYTMNFE